MVIFTNTAPQNVSNCIYILFLAHIRDTGTTLSLSSGPDLSGVSYFRALFWSLNAAASVGSALHFSPLRVSSLHRPLRPLSTEQEKWERLDLTRDIADTNGSETRSWTQKTRLCAAADRLCAEKKKR